MSAVAFATQNYKYFIWVNEQKYMEHKRNKKLKLRLIYAL